MNVRSARILCTSLVVLCLLVCGIHAVESRKPVKVFILAGQSNMEGKAKLALAEYQAEQDATRNLYAPYRADGKWRERDDVWIKFLDRKGKLTAGFGSPAAIGPELGFGWAVGDRLEEPVILIKTAWGGRSLYRDFRPPSAGLPAPAVLEKMLADQRKRKPETTASEVEALFGASYRAMLAEVNATVADLKSVYPEYSGEGHELAGFIWFQGWNDMISADATAEHAANLAHFIRDIRKDLGVPRLPFVIGQMGVGGANADPNVQRFKDAQAKVVEVPEFQGNVALVKTDAHWDADAEAVFKKGWKENRAEWDRVGSDFPYHYLGSPRTMLGIGRAFADAVLELRAKGNASR